MTWAVFIVCSYSVVGDPDSFHVAMVTPAHLDSTESVHY